MKKNYDLEFEKSEKEIDTYETIEEKRYPQEHDDGGIIIPDDLNEKEMNASQLKALFKRSRRKYLFHFITS